MSHLYHLCSSFCPPAPYVTPQDARIARFEATTGGGSSGDAAAGSEDEDDKIQKAEKVRLTSFLLHTVCQAPVS